MEIKPTTILRHVVDSDSTFIRQCLKESDVTFLSQKFIDKLTSCEDWIYNALRSTEEEIFLIHHRKEKELVPVGVLNLHSIDFDLETAEMSMVIMRKHCSIGHGRRSREQLSEYALQIMGLDETKITIHHANIPALKSVKKRD